jgi:CRP-like cAMP-binding protein
MSDGREFNIEFYAENQFVSAFTSFLTQSPSEWRIEALETCEIFLISRSLLSQLYLRHSCWIEFGKLIFEQQTIKKCRREKSLLTQDAAGRYQLFQTEYRTIENRIPQYQIASYLGIAPETLSRLRSK